MNLSHEWIAETASFDTAITSLTFANISFQDSTYKIAVHSLPEGQGSSLTFNHSTNLADDAGFSYRVSPEGAATFRCLEPRQLQGGTFSLDLNANLSTLAIDGGISIGIASKAETLAITVNGAAVITTLEPLALTTLSCQISGAASLDLSGTSETASYSLDGAGSVQAKDLKAKNVTASIDGAGSMVVYASSSLNASIEGVGSITYYGSPTDVVTSGGGIGSIKPA